MKVQIDLNTGTVEAGTKTVDLDADGLRAEQSHLDLALIGYAYEAHLDLKEGTLETPTGLHDLPDPGYEVTTVADDSITLDVV